MAGGLAILATPGSDVKMRSGAGRVLVYNRIDANRRATRNLLIVFGLVSLPAAVYLSIYLAFVGIVFIIVALGPLSVATGLADGNVALWLVVVAAFSAVILVALPVVISRYSAALMLRLSRARPAGEDAYPALWRTVENLCVGAGLPMPRLNVIDSRAANAFSTGLSPETSSLVVTTGLLQLLQKRELEGVLAHELVQIGNYDTRLATVLAAAVAFLRLPYTAVIGFFRFFFRVHWTIGGFVLLYVGLPLAIGIAAGPVIAIDQIGDDPAFGYALLAAWCVPMYCLFVSPLIAELLRSAVMRRRHFLADADAVLLARNAEPLALALTKMTAAGALVEFPVASSTTHLWTVDPLRAGWWRRIWPGSHPPLPKRVSLLGGMGAGILPSHFEEAIAAGEAFAASAKGQPWAAAATDLAASNNAPESAELAEAKAFRLAAPGTPVYARPDANSTVIERLPMGALVTVRQTAIGFLHVITSGERFGYIAESTPLHPVQMPKLRD